ncbi:MAG: penicillin-binding transpeptidase domain-containing protein [Lachnospiraceae bacterium]|nr:penicillin-binding transpeptidase domain-containing protein [Lachnospiraceae bacterium]
MLKNKTRYRKKVVILTLICTLLFLGLTIRLTYLMVNKSEYYTQKAEDLHQRERKIKAKRGKIIDATGKILADNKTVCNISVIHSQIKEPEKVVELLSTKLGLSKEYVEKRVKKVSSIEKIKSNVEKEIGDEIRAANLDGIKVDEDYKRYYPYGSLASKALGFTGGDNQGIIGLEVEYDDVLQGEGGTILTYTDARGVEIAEKGEERLEPKDGENLCISLDINIQEYATQLARQAMATKEAESVSIIVMNPQNGEIMAMVNVPEFDLNDPYTLKEGVDSISADTSEMDNKEIQDALNKMWRNGCINDTYEPGSVFKIITAAAGLEEGVVTTKDSFSCPGFIVVEDRRIRCHKRGGHGSETFIQGTMNSCNPVFVSVGLRLGTEKYYSYFEKFGLLQKTGIDLPGEASTIMHKEENIGLVELATISFGQSFQVTPIQLATTVSSLINGGKRITPHFAVKTTDTDNQTKKVYRYEEKEQILTEETSETLRMILEQVVENGSGKNGYVEGYRVGGKTATSETLPRGRGIYISSFLGFAPADNPQVLALAIINKPKGTYYGGTIAAPIVRQLFENILPYLEGMDYNEQRK